MITLRELLIRIGVNADDAALARFDRGLQILRNGMELTVLAARKLSDATLGVVVAESAAAEEAIRQAKALGQSVEAFQELKNVVEGFDADVGDLVDAIATIADRSEDAASGVQSMADDFALVGITIDRKFLALNPEERFLAFADAISKTEDDSKRLTASVRILGDDAGRKLGPLMQLGAEGIQRLRDEAQLTGQVLDQETAEGAARAAVSFRRLGGAVRGIRRQLAARAAPAIAEIANRIRDWIIANSELIDQRIDRVVEFITRAAEGLSDRFDQLNDFVRDEVSGWENIFQQIEKVVRFLATGGAFLALIRALNTVRGLLISIDALAVANPMGILFLAIAAAVVLAALAIEDFLVFLRGGDSVFGSFLDMFDRAEPALAEFLNLFGAIGRLGTALGAIFLSIGNALISVLPSFETLEGLFKSFSPVVLEFLLAFETIIVALSNGIDNLTLALTDFSGFLVVNLEKTVGFLETISKVLDDVIDKVPGLGASLRGAIGFQAGIAGAGAGIVERARQALGPVSVDPAAQAALPGARAGVSGAAVNVEGSQIVFQGLVTPEQFAEEVERMEERKLVLAMGSTRGGTR